MQLAASTLEHLQDEAYAFLCREALRDHLSALEQKKAEINDTRPPFGLLARKETRDAFTQSMRTALEDEAALRDRLARIDGIEDWLRPLIRNSVSAYLAEVSPSYCALLQLSARLDDWENAFHGVPEIVQALARDVRGLRTAASAPGATSQDYTHELAVLRDVAERLNRRHRELFVIEQAVAGLATKASATEIRLPVLPNLQRLPWIARLAVLPVSQVVTEATQCEAELRVFLSDGSASVAPRLETSREACADLTENALEQYWNQLRGHARIHYVQERDVDDVLAMLTQRYVDATLKRRQEALPVAPFGGGR